MFSALVLFIALVSVVLCRPPGGDKIVFPGQSGNAFVPQVPDSCKSNLTFCTNSYNYPSTYVENVLKNVAGSYRQFLGIDEIEDDTIGQRINDLDENVLCNSNEQLVFPKTAQNKDYKWLFIVNHSKYVQGVRIETCQQDNSECLFSDSFPSGYSSSCKQKYIYRKLLAIDNSGDTVLDNFRLPSCCSCVVVSSPFDTSFNLKQTKARRRRKA